MTSNIFQPTQSFIHAWTKKIMMHSLAYQTRIWDFTLMTFYQWVTGWGSIINMMIRIWWHRRFGLFDHSSCTWEIPGHSLRRWSPLQSLQGNLGFPGVLLEWAPSWADGCCFFSFLSFFLPFPFFFFLSILLLTVELWSSEEEERDEFTTGREGIGLGWGRSSLGGEVKFETLGVTGITRLNSQTGNPRNI